MPVNEIRCHAEVILVKKLPLQPVMLGLGLGLVFGLEAKIIGLGPGRVPITPCTLTSLSGLHTHSADVLLSAWKWRS